MRLTGAPTSRTPFPIRVVRVYPGVRISPGTFSFAPGGCLHILGPLVGPDRPPRPVRATRTRTSTKRGESSIHPVASNIAAVLSKASEFGIEIPPFPTSDLFPDELPGVPTPGSALASVENLIAWNCELWNSWRDYASAHISHNALLAQVEVSKQGIADHDARCRLVWATWCYLQGCSVIANAPESSSLERRKSWSKGKGKGKGKGKAHARSSDESIIQLVEESIDRGDGQDEEEKDEEVEGEVEESEDEDEDAGALGGSVMEIS